MKLLTDYRQYLLEIADGGAGPFYGLYSLDEGTELAKDFAGKLDDLLSRPFPLDNAATRAFLDHVRTCIENGDDDEIVYPEVPEPCPGLAFLCDYGCGWSYALVANGEQAGTVWFVGEYLSPIHRDGKQLSFLQRIDGWLDDELAALNPNASEPPKPKDQTILNYDGHPLTALPPEALDNPRLKKLVLSRSQLKEFPRPILELRELRSSTCRCLRRPSCPTSSRASPSCASCASTTTTGPRCRTRSTNSLSWRSCRSSTAMT